MIFLEIYIVDENSVGSYESLFSVGNYELNDTVGFHTQDDTLLILKNDEIIYTKQTFCSTQGDCEYFAFKSSLGNPEKISLYSY